MKYSLFFDFSYDSDFQLFLPNTYIAIQKNNFWYFFKKATDEVLKSLSLSLSNEQNEIIFLINSLQNPILLEKYIKKETTIYEIYKNKEKKKYIQQQIEEKTAQILEKIIEKNFFITVNYKKEDVLDKQFLKITKKELSVSLTFEKITDGIFYRLLLWENTEKIIPQKNTIILLNNEKSWLVLNGKLLKISNIKLQPIQPFLEKDEIFIPEKIIPQYFDKFLKEIIKKVEITTIGFDIIQKNEIVGAKLKYIYDFFTNHYKIYIEFDYNGYYFYSNQAKKEQSNLKIEENNTIKIDYYKRNLAEEAKKYQILENLGFINEDGNFSIKENYPFASCFYLLKNKENLLKLGFFIENLEIERKKVNIEPFSLSFNETTEKNDWFDLHIKVKIGENSFVFSEFIKNIKENNPIFELPDGEIFIIPQEWFSKYEKIAKFSKISNEKLQIPKNNYALLEELPEIKPKTLVKEVNYVASPNLKTTLRPYQEEGVKWLLEHYYNGMGACLADDMGLGKTLQTIALLVDIHDKLPENLIENPTNLFEIGQKQKEMLKILIILPSSLVFNWYDEVKRFAPQFKCTQYIGNNRKIKAKRLLNYDIVLTSYPIVAKDAEILQKYEFRYIILDESQRIKNKNSQIFKIINSLNAKNRISLSGTPIENSLSDLWAQMQFINPNILGNFNHFSKYFKIEIEKKHNPLVLEELKTIISPFLLRRTKLQVIKDLPEIEEQIAYCELSEEQAKWYESEKSKIRNQLLFIDLETDRVSALNMLTKLRQISNHPKLLDKDSKIASGKYEEVINYFELLLQTEQKALIFSSFVSHLSIYEQWCKENKIKYATLTGETPTANRKAEVEKFQKDKNVKFFFISLKAGEVGLNLTSASYVFLLDPWWNPFSERQAIARAHRLGQENKVNVVRFVSKNTIEEKIIKLQQQKTELSQNIIEENTIINDILVNLNQILD
ncbi:MAG: SNF2-related protein [Capnocytophaga sp.]|nr:SNF2-related protein [Capnocytophaga sp.]